MKKIKWGILSTAKIAKQKVFPSIQNANNCEVIALVSRDAQKAVKTREYVFCDKNIDIDSLKAIQSGEKNKSPPDL